MGASETLLEDLATGGAPDLLEAVLASSYGPAAAAPDLLEALLAGTEANSCSAGETIVVFQAP